jgi:hypothetical protein
MHRYYSKLATTTYQSLCIQVKKHFHSVTVLFTLIQRLYITFEQTCAFSALLRFSHVEYWPKNRLVEQFSRPDQEVFMYTAANCSVGRVRDGPFKYFHCCLYAKLFAEYGGGGEGKYGLGHVLRRLMQI